MGCTSRRASLRNDGIRRRVPISVPFYFSARHGAVVGYSSDAHTEFGALNLATGRWTKLATDSVDFTVFHPERPWIAIESPAGYFVLDLRNGRRVLELKTRETERELVLRGDGPALFLPRTDLLLAPVSILDKNSEKHRDGIEVWKVNESAGKPEVRFDGLCVGADPTVASNGLVAWTDHETNPISVQILDPKAGTVVRLPPTAEPFERPSFDWREASAVFSLDRQTIYFNGTLWDIEHQRPLWSKREHETCSATPAALEIDETWERLFGKWAEPLKTSAIRDTSTGRLRFRLWTVPDVFRFSSDFMGANRANYIDRHGAIRSFLPPPNWPLLALCQTILALPLLLLWAALRWRCKRRMRLAGAAP